MGLFSRKKKDQSAKGADAREVALAEESDESTSSEDTAADADSAPAVNDDVADSPADEADDAASTSAAEDTGDADDAADEGASDAATDDSEPDDESSAARSHLDFDRGDGPFDLKEVDSELEGWIDFGGLAIVPEPGMEVRLDVNESGQEITGLTAVVGQGACQLQAFAAPKSSGLWDDIRDEIHDNLIESGAQVQEQEGPLGLELVVRIPTPGPDGRTVQAPMRFLGVDGPRWFLRAVLSGAAAADEETAEHMVQFIRRTVVVRGDEARAPRQMLPLKVPENLHAEDEAADEQAAPNQDDFKPFERGPEITEVR